MSYRFLTGFGLGPFAFQAHVREQLASELDYKSFHNFIRDAFGHLSTPLSDQTIEFLFDVGIQARVDKKLLFTARQIVTGQGWKSSRRKTKKLISALKAFKGADIESRLRFVFGHHENISAGTARKLNAELLELELVCDWWEEHAAWSRWKRFYAAHMLNMGRHLAAHYEISSAERAEIISTVIKELKVETKVSEEAIEKSLRREMKAPRRFVFVEPNPPPTIKDLL